DHRGAVRARRLRDELSSALAQRAADAAHELVAPSRLEVRDRQLLPFDRRDDELESRRLAEEGLGGGLPERGAERWPCRENRLGVLRAVSFRERGEASALFGRGAIRREGAREDRESLA